MCFLYFGVHTQVGPSQKSIKDEIGNCDVYRQPFAHNAALYSGGSGGGGGGGGGASLQKLRAIHTKRTTNTVLSMQTHTFT